MDIINDMTKALEFIEEKLCDDISVEDVAEHLYVSKYHFHRTFSMVAGIGPKEYIRNRRLSMAGQEITMSDVKIIDVALKYGYSNPESFTKAFKRFHGVTPNVARRAGMELKSYNRLRIKIKLEGGTVMDYRIEKREGFKVLVKVESFRNESIKEEGNTEIPDFWKRCGEDGTFKTLTEHAGDRDVLGLCSPISKDSGFFKYAIGKQYDGEDVPEGFELWTVRPQLWTVFKCKGDDPECIGDTWDSIFQQYLPGSEYQMEDYTDFELYSDNFEEGCFCEIWIPVKKK